MKAISIYRQFWRYTIPTVAAMLVNGLYQVVDGIFIGHYVGADGLAGINVSWPIIGAILGLGMMVGVGTGSLASIKQGEKDLTAARSVLATGLIMLLVLAPLIAVTLYYFSESFLLWQGVSGRIFELGSQYLNVLIIGCVFTLGSIAMPFLLRNDDSPNLATMLMVVGALVNIVLDYLFIARFGWELTGAALATMIAQIVVTVLGLAYFFSKRATLRLSRATLRLNLSAIPSIVMIGTSSFFMYAYGSFMVAIHNALFSQYGSPILIGAYAILGYIVTMYYLIAEGVANGMQPLVSFHYGAKNHSNIRKLVKVAITTAVAVGVVFVLLLNALPYQFVSVFNNSDQALMDSTVHGLRLHLFAMFLDGFLVVAAAYYQAVNRGGKAMFVTIGNMLVQLPFLYIMPKIWGLDGVWLAFPLSNIALSAVVIVMFWRDVRYSPRDPSGTIQPQPELR
ncbi:MATE family efflux transporter [Vibrio sp. SM6]|uniref:Multidrug export protein MepA n=1 Tax=Vibrio agarilyticus TaxID=2726741 RepID=A0A7X8TR58_9VIBR|nr:MATE family efflux transporter [Vibrio agarilyticus]NLS12718.1 MATE family efflux transporter [Vibrio agarilyticus]